MIPRTKYSDLIATVAARHGLPPNTLEAQVIVESSGRADVMREEPGYYERYIIGNPRALGQKYGPLAGTSFGLLQIILETALEVGFTGNPWDLFDPETGLEFGARNMRILWTWAGGQTVNYEQALAAYNGGKGGNEVKPYRNQAYATRVLNVSSELPPK